MVTVAKSSLTTSRKYFMLNYLYIIDLYVTVKPVLRDHAREDQIWSLKTGGLLTEGHLSSNVRPGEMKLWYLDRGGLLIEVVARAG